MLNDRGIPGISIDIITCKVKTSGSAEAILETGRSHRQFVRPTLQRPKRAGNKTVRNVERISTDGNERRSHPAKCTSLLLCAGQFQGWTERDVRQSLNKSQLYLF